MNNILVLLIIIPVLSGILMIFIPKKITVQKWISSFSLLLTFIVSLTMIQQVAKEGISTLYLGGWIPPFGIVLVADMFAILLVSTTLLVSIACLLFAFRSIGEERERYYFYPFFQFLTAGVCGSFLTGDLFNLFVFFEVMLISSYVLISLGGSRRQLRESIKYVLINIVSSILFIVAVAYLYAVTGTLNMADLSQRVAEVNQEGVLTLISMLFLIVFGIKAGLFLFYWLPGSYSSPPTAVAAIFSALLTKVGVYAIFRMFTLIFYHQPEITHQLIGWLAAATMLVGVIGAVGHSDVRKILAYNVVAAVGFIALGVSILTTVALAGAVFYLIHDMIIKALLFLIGGVMISLTGKSRLQEMGGLIKHHPLLGWMFFIAAIALAGVPPLSGFMGKLMIIQGGLEAGQDQHHLYWLIGISLLSSLLILYSVMKIFMNGFFGEVRLRKEEEKGKTTGLLAPCLFLVALSIALGLGAEWIYDYVWLAAEGLMNPQNYIQAVLKE